MENDWEKSKLMKFVEIRMREKRWYHDVSF